MLIRLFFIILGQWDISHWLLPFQDHFTIWSKGYLYFTTTFSDFVVRFFLPFPSSRCLSQRQHLHILSPASGKLHQAIRNQSERNAIGD